ESSRVHHKQIRIPEPGGLNGPEDVRDVSPGDATQDVRGGEAGVVQKVSNVVGGNVEVAEAVIQIHTTPGSRATRDVVLSLPCWRCRRKRDCCIKPGGRNWRGRVD